MLAGDGNKDHTYEGNCLCGETSYIAKGEPMNPHMCSCTMCQRSSGALTLVWAGFKLENFTWTKLQPKRYQSTKPNEVYGGTERLSCESCGGLLGTYNYNLDGSRQAEIWITTGALKERHLIVPGQQHSFEEAAPTWWHANIDEKKRQSGLKDLYLESSSSLFAVKKHKTVDDSHQDSANANIACSTPTSCC